MEFVLPELPQAARYKLLTALIIPRPIGWITSLDSAGRVNLAPYSFFNVLGNAPPIVAFGPSRREDGTLKDTQANVESAGEFVVNLVTPECLEVMHQTAAPYPPGVSEVEALELATLPSQRVRTPRLALSPVHLECVYERTVVLGQNNVVFGEIVVIHAPDGLIDPETFRLGSEPWITVGRLAGPGHYATTRDQRDLGPMPKVRGNAATPPQK